MSTLVERLAQAVVAEMHNGNQITRVDRIPCNPWEAAREALRTIKPDHWEVEFPAGKVTIDNEAIALAQLRNGYKVTPLFKGDPL